MSPALTFLGLICNNLLRCTERGERSNVCKSCQSSSRKTVTEWICMKTLFPSFRLARRTGCGSTCWEAWPRAVAHCSSLSGGNFFLSISFVPSRPFGSISSCPPRGGVMLRKTVVRVDPWRTVPPSALPTFRVPGTLFTRVGSCCWRGRRSDPGGEGNCMKPDPIMGGWSWVPRGSPGGSTDHDWGNSNRAVRTLGD